MVLDMLEATDPTSARPYILLRAIQVFSNFPNTNRTGLASRHYVILAEPETPFSSSSRNADNLKILAAKRYYMHIPSYEEMTSLTNSSPS
jgi:hypothetical protein